MADFTRDENGAISGVVIETPEGPMVAALGPVQERHTVDDGTQKESE